VQACHRRRTSLHTLPLPTGDPPRASSLSWSATRSTWPLPKHLPRRRPGPSRCRRWPSTACASFERQAPTRADDQPVVDTVRATTPTPAVLAVWLLAASARLTNSPGSDTADAERPDSGCRIPRCPDAQLDTGHRTPDAHTGQRTPGRLDAHTGHWTPVAWTSPAWTLDAYTGQRTPDSGHRTLAEDADTVT
jgi:hypothetical protein